MDKEKKIFVFADFQPYHEEIIGTIYVSQTRGKEFYSFEYDQKWLEKGNMILDPDLQMYKGRQYIHDDKKIFGVFADSCPDRWGQRLMKRREELRAKNAGEKPRKLLDSDYLLGVYDEARMGGLRFKTELEGEFLSNDREFATPPWTSLRELEQASIAFENDEKGLNEKWLKQLLAPGSSLGGARPKASVLATDGSLWIAKFPSKHDDFNSGAWEMVVHELAVMCGLNVPEAKAEKFSRLGTTFLVKRFDRIESRRIVFSMAVSNTDDHFRNHGFILEEKGWVLSPMYDVNPDIYGEFLSLNVDEDNSAIDFDLAIEAAPYYEISTEQAKKNVTAIRKTVADNWRSLAGKYGISRGEIERMCPAFQGDV